jgi:hypothetical protein
MLILDVDPWLAAHLAVTFHAHRARLRAAWQATPVQLTDIERALATRAKTCQDGSDLIDRVGDVDHGAMTTLLLSIEDVARVLSISERTVIPEGTGPVKGLFVALTFP